MLKRKSDERGFTLIEVIVTLVLVGFTTVLAGMFIVYIANGYIFAKMNANTLQKAQLAMARLETEFRGITSVTSATSSQITYTRTQIATAGGSVPVTVFLSGNTLRINVNNTGNNILTDSVSNGGFSLQYCNYNPVSGSQVCGTDWPATGTRVIINITLTLTGANGIGSTFTSSIVPRNL